MINAYALTHEKILSTNIQDFDCGDEGLNNYLKDYRTSKNNHDEYYNNTTVMINDIDNTVVAYFTTRFNALIIEDIEVEDLENEINEINETLDIPNVIPALEIQYLAVNDNEQFRGYGSSILAAILGRILQISEDFGCRFIFLWSIRNQDIIDFYKKNGFKEMRLTSEGENLMLMRLDLLPLALLQNQSK